MNGSPNPESGDGAENGSRFKFRSKMQGTGVQRHSREERLIPGTDGVSTEDPEIPGPGTGSTSEMLITPHPIPHVLEVWFAGCHSDVGGGAVEDGVSHSLADISLRWMVKQVSLSPCGVLFNDAAVRRAGLDISTVGFLNPTMPITGEGPVEIEAVPSGPQGGDGAEFFVSGSELKIVEERPWFREQDVLSDVNDEMKRQPWKWWFLEILPVKYVWQDAKGRWRHRRGCVPINSI